MSRFFAALSLAGVVPMAAVANEDPASLDRLADIVVPAAVPWWPPAPAWYAVMAVVVVLVALGLTALWRRRRRNAYRAAALAELDRAGRGPAALMYIAETLKRTALAAGPGRAVAALSGERWVSWLAQTGNGVNLSDNCKEILTRQLYDAVEPGDEALDELLDFARAWVRKHRVDPSPEFARTPGGGIS